MTSSTFAPARLGSPATRFHAPLAEAGAGDAATVAGTSDGTGVGVIEGGATVLLGDADSTGVAGAAEGEADGVVV